MDIFRQADDNIFLDSAMKIITAGCHSLCKGSEPTVSLNILLVVMHNKPLLLELESVFSNTPS